ncbi:CehA/McbA family metallohydrolase [Paenibacillus sedimenti]|uniref:CehA/McbA family metallohydrolase n=1 Tax=Paenibacillus sedimenti TaxID=2770274 RepID=A0A926KPA3_9BACL|nr:CehA/McbA family metallohydrolase [Paenibacillus sedimenti]MBD0381405.1 CehA/McbA family metallohydrolase [Paenibacillus sedimenti]
MPWIACELHTHTFHSDGRQTLRELSLGAKALGFDCITLTDHNTMTGLQDKESVERETGISIISGMEWTTFYGHMVTIGLTAFVDWRPVGPGDIHAGIARVHAQGGIAGMAHPFRMGSPLCTGCYWEFSVSDWNDIDYIEVWSGTFPSIKSDNARAFRLWTGKLNEGFRIAATSGRDWHVQEPVGGDPVSVTYLGLEEGDVPVTEKAVRALSAGRASVTIGPLLLLEIEAEGNVYGLGETVSGDRDPLVSMIAIAFVDFSVRKGIWDLPEQTYILRLIGNAGVMAEYPVNEENPRVQSDIRNDGLIWMRAELWGTVRGVRALIAFTNAIYFES